MSWIKVWMGLAFCLMAACSNQQAYQAIQENRQQDCRKNSPNPSVFEACMKANSQSYDEYERQRDALLKTPQRNSKTP